MKEQALSRGAFIKMASTIALPIMVQNLISTLVNTADTLMLGYVGQAAMSASSLASNAHTIMWCIVSGLSTGAAVLGSQYWGKKDIDTIERALGLAIRFCVGVGILTFLLCFLAPGAVMSLFTNDPEIIEQGIIYLRVLSFSFLFESFSITYFAVLRSAEKILIPSISVVMSLFINVLINATFIFGLFGMPKLGVAGVALGTVAARAFEVLLCLLHSLTSKDIRFRIRYVFADAGVLMKDFLSQGIPSSVNDAAWSLSVAVYSIILGHMGSDAVAANAVAAMAMNIGGIVCRGFASATTIIIGKVLGQGLKETGKLYSKRMLGLTVFFSVLGGLVMVAIRPLISTMYRDKLTETALSYFGIMMLMQAYRLTGEGLNTCWICGCFRGGGDSKFGMIVDTLCIWLIAVPATAAAAYVFKAPVLVVYFVMCLDEFEKMPFVLHHYLQYKWLNNITRDKAELEG
jgi:putative MATE family efflux protein